MRTAGDSEVLTIFLVEDDKVMLHSLKIMLETGEKQVFGFSNPVDAIAYLDEVKPDLFISDYKMPDMNGLDLFHHVRDKYPEIRRILLSAYPEFDSIIDAFNEGIIHSFLCKPVTKELLNKTISKNLKSINKKGKRQLSAATSPGFMIPDTPLQSFHGILTAEPELLANFDMIKTIVKSGAPIFVHGETGTGKELMARAIHAEGPRREKPFIAVNCATFSSGILESQLFGHKKGAFTGATKDQKGLFEAADGGTLFLDEVTEIPLDLQAKLLRVIQEKEYVPIGSTLPLKVDTHIVSASSTSLQEAIENRNFRPDLKFRLEVMPINLPPLRKRKHDIRPLFIYFTQLAMNSQHSSLDSIDNEIFPVLESYQWPGNIREMQNLCTYLVAIADHKNAIISKELLPQNILNLRPGAMNNERPQAHVTDEPPLTNKKITLQDIQPAEIQKLLDESHGNRSAVARQLGVSRMTLWRHIKKIGL